MTIVSLFVSSPDTYSERRLDTSLTVRDLKEKLTPITGIQPQYQRITLQRSAEDPSVIARLDNEDATLGSYDVQEYQCLKVDSTDPNARPGEFSDLSAVDKFELTPEQYEQRSDTVLAHLKANKLGRFADVPTALAHPPPRSVKSVPDELQPGARCLVRAGEDSMERRGTVRYVGEAKIGKGGVWVGVELDEPVGKGDGSVEDQRYFTCRPHHGVFVRPEKVTVGDFPEEDLMADDDDEI